jgi:hypothetical protein
MTDAAGILVRNATVDDLDAVVSLTRSRRGQLAAWEDPYWRPRSGIDELHPIYLRWCIEENPSTDVVVATDGAGVDGVVGCLIVIRQEGQWFFDDFCVADNRWSDVGGALLRSRSEAPGLLCAPKKDEHQHEWLCSTALTLASTFHALAAEAGPVSSPVPPAASVPVAPRHPFGPFGADTENGLYVSTVYGCAIGSPAAQPPAFDPGGPTTVVDRVGGSDRAKVVQAVVSAAAARGDARLIFVVDASDSELAGILTTAGATIPVNLWLKSGG